MKRVLEFLFLSVALIASSCNRDDVIIADPLPEILLGESGGVYSVKVGNEVRLAPDYENAKDATYSWKIDGVEVGTERSYIFLGEEIGSYYISLSVTTAAGSDSEELRVDVISREIPTIDIVGESKVVLALGSEKNFNSSVVDTSLDVTIRWSLDGQECGEGASYTFEAQEIGNYTLRATATNSDGEAFDEVTIEVLSAEDMPFMWDFEKESYHTVVGRKLLIAPTQISDIENIVYMWQLGNEGEAIEGDSHFVFTADTAGEYQPLQQLHERAHQSLSHISLSLRSMRMARTIAQRVVRRVLIGAKSTNTPPPLASLSMRQRREASMARRQQLMQLSPMPRLVCQTRIGCRLEALAATLF